MWLKLARGSMACNLFGPHVVRLSHLAMSGAGKRKKGKHGKVKPAPAEDDDIDAILAEIGEAPNGDSAPADEGQPGEHFHKGMPSRPLYADWDFIGRGWQRQCVPVEDKPSHQCITAQYKHPSWLESYPRSLQSCAWCTFAGLGPSYSDPSFLEGHLFCMCQCQQQTTTDASLADAACSHDGQHVIPVRQVKPSCFCR